MRPALEVADIVRAHGDEFRQAHAASLSPRQKRVLRSIELCRTAALGGHLERCDQCGHERNAYNSCADRHCPKCQSLARAKWLEKRQAELLPCEYFHAVFTLPAPLATLALQNKRQMYDLLFRATAETLQSIAADPKRLGVQIGFFCILHSWGQTLTAHPHLHCVVPGGGISLDGSHWVACRPRFLLPVRVLSSRFRRLYLRYLEQAYRAGKLRFHGQLQHLSDPASFARYLAPLRKTKWVVYAKPPFGGPERVLDYLGRYTHRVAISNHRLQQLQDGQVTFVYKDYKDGHQQKLMTLSADESAAVSAACTPTGLPANSPLWSLQQPTPCGKPGPLSRTSRCFGSYGSTTTGLWRALPATHWTGSVAMPAVPERSDAADRCSPCGRRNHRMG
jgi:hypothetical protein